ncbi:lysine-rich arabinogalactan protein 19-like [Panicum virgatum]|uniref:lysine-rich arabinogalactan protein 19-like n=1 Tax=Panicum virgatum TaxID=38727 RepID=UPI0019D6158E|nr:lysine-rich arabinogalactan protein 19-like [Panicum virgatum]
MAAAHASPPRAWHPRAPPPPAQRRSPRVSRSRPPREARRRPPAWPPRALPPVWRGLCAPSAGPCSRGSRPTLEERRGEVPASAWPPRVPSSCAARPPARALGAAPPLSRSSPAS